jgi:hypothetical protein
MNSERCLGNNHLTYKNKNYGNSKKQSGYAQCAFTRIIC